MIEVVQNPDGTWRITDVPIISTGIEYPLSTGPTTFTDEQLADAVEAMQEDPAIVEPRIKLGHTSGYNEALVGDAEQAFGRLDAETVYLGDNGQTIYGDITGLPEWLAKVMSIAYPNRSVEANFDTETVTGRKYKLVINAVSLLGVLWPGCQVLEDLPLWYGSDTPTGIVFSQDMSAQLAASGGGMRTRRGDKTSAAVDVSQIRRTFYNQAMSGEIDAPEGTNTYWWWIRGEKIDSTAEGMYLIVDDEENGDLYKVPVEVTNNEISFGDATKVVEEFVPVAARAAVVAGMAAVDERLVVHAAASETGGPDKSTQEGASNMDEATRKKLAASLGLPETATEGEINAKLQSNAVAGLNQGPEQGAEGGEPDNAGTRGGDLQPGEQPPAHQTPPGTAPSGTAPAGNEEQEQREAEEAGREPEADAEAGTVTVDRKTWNDTLQGAALARKHEADRVSASRNEILDTAVRAGKFAPARRAHYEKLLASDFEGGKAIIDQLQAGLVPVDERGSGGGGEDVNANQGGVGLPDEWFPEIAAIRANSAGTRLVTNAKEG